MSAVALDELNSKFDASLANVKAVKAAQDLADAQKKRVQQAQAKLNSDSDCHFSVN